MTPPSERQSRRRLSREQRRQGILEAAARTFSERGFDRASIGEIASEAGITKPVIYHHFASKQELYIALLELYRGELLASLGRRAVAEPTPEGRLRAGLEGFLEFLETHPHAWRLLLADPPPTDETIVEAHRQLEQRTIAGMLPLLAAAPTVEHPSDPTGAGLVIEREMAAETIKSAADGLAAWWYEHREVERGHLVSVLMNVLWIGFERFVAGERWSDESGHLR